MSSNSTIGLDDNLEISAMALTNRIPDLWPQSIKLWLSHIEAVMAPQKPTDDIMYQMVIAKLRHQDLQQVSDIIANPPEERKFQTLKERLIHVYEESAQKQFKKLMEDMELGDQKPSQLLRRMKELAGDTVSPQALKFLWGSHLPKAARTILAIHENKDLSELAEMADAIQENTAIEPVRFLHEVSSLAPPDMNKTKARIDAIDELRQQIAQLTLQISELTTGNQQRRSRSTSRSNYRSDSPWRQRSRARAYSPRPSGWHSFKQEAGGPCFYHSFFGEEAHRCRQPCSWSQKKQDSYNNQKN